MYHTFILGLTVLETGKFDSNFLMPICLPTSDKFKDDDRGKFKCTQRSHRESKLKISGGSKLEIYFVYNQTNIAYFMIIRGV